MAACALLRGGTGFFNQNVFGWMSLLVFLGSRFDTILARKRESFFIDQVFLQNFKRLLKPEFLSATAVATANFTSIKFQ